MCASADASGLPMSDAQAIGNARSSSRDPRGAVNLSRRNWLAARLSRGLA